MYRLNPDKVVWSPDICFVTASSFPEIEVTSGFRSKENLTEVDVSIKKSNFKIIYFRFLKWEIGYLPYQSVTGA